MLEHVIQEFASRIGLNSAVQLDAEHSFEFTLDGKYLISLKCSQGEEEYVLMTLAVELREYEKILLRKFLQHAAFEHKRYLDFTVGYVTDKLLLITTIDKDISIDQFEQKLLLLVKQYNTILEA